MVRSDTLLTRSPLVSGASPCYRSTCMCKGMPPAFNLSQDQTLQFNPTNLQFTDSNSHYLMDLSIRVIALMLCCDLSHFASRHPHLSVVQVFKDHLRCAKHLSPSAAQKRDYEPLPYSLKSDRVANFALITARASGGDIQLIRPFDAFSHQHQRWYSCFSTLLRLQSLSRPKNIWSLSPCLSGSTTSALQFVWLGKRIAGSISRNRRLPYI